MFKRIALTLLLVVGVLHFLFGQIDNVMDQVQDSREHAAAVAGL